MKICLITSCLSFGGAEKMLCWLATKLIDEHEVFIIDLKSNVNKVDYRRELDRRIKVFDLEARGIKVLKRINQIKRVIRTIKQENADAVIGFTTYPNFLASVSGKKLHIPSIVSERCDPTRESRGFLNRFYKYFINRADGGVFQLHESKTFYNKRLQEKSVVIPNPVFFPNNFKEYKVKKEKTVISIGRLDNYQKRYDVLIRAFTIFHASHPDYSLRIYGDGPDKNEILRFIVDNNVQSFVSLCGITNTPLNDLARGEMFAITSDFEGISNSLLEAMAIGMPVISTDSSPGGARMLIENEKNGLLVPCGSYIDVADAMSRFSDDLALRFECSRNAKKVLVRFNPDRIYSLWHEFIFKTFERFHSKQNVK